MELSARVNAGSRAWRSGWACQPAPTLAVTRDVRDAAAKRLRSTDVLSTLAVRLPPRCRGYHPEGTRSKGDDPYALLPVQPGIGNILSRAKPIVVPVFTLGLINNFPKQIWSNFDGSGKPVTMVFGKPMDLSRFADLPDGPETWRVIADAVRDELVALGEVERAFRVEKGLPALGPAKH